jgi:hypothetical protein
MGTGNVRRPEPEAGLSPACSEQIKSGGAIPKSLIRPQGAVLSQAQGQRYRS